MEFKIDTKPAYSCITPIATSLDANLTEQLSQKYEDLRQTGSYNLIIDLQHCTDADTPSLAGLILLHENMYSNEHSLVFTGLQPQVMNRLKENETDLALNIAPTMDEAKELISMEILERDLFNENNS